MSKSIRIKDYLVTELERLAEKQDRSLTNLVNLLLEQAVRMETSRKNVLRTQGSAAEVVAADSQDRGVQARTIVPPPADVPLPKVSSAKAAEVATTLAEGSFRPDFKGGKKK